MPFTSVTCYTSEDLAMRVTVALLSGVETALEVASDMTVQERLVWRSGSGSLAGGGGEVEV